MAGIGEATAIAATVQLGFSLAKTLTAVVGDYQSAREDINCIATEVDATLSQAAELDALVQDNAHTKRLNDRGLKLATKCKIDLTRIVEKLIRLLTKAGVPEHQPYTIKPDDIEVSKFKRAAWFILKPQVTVIQRELNSVRLQILLAHTCIDAESAPSKEDREAASKLIPGLQKSRQLARRLVREAQNQREKAAESVESNRGIVLQPAPCTSGLSRPPTYRGPSAMEYARTSGSRNAFNSADVVPPAEVPHHVASNDSDTDRVADELRRELEQELLTKLERKVKEQEAISNYDKRVRDEAVEGYKQSTRERLSTMKERAAETRRRLHESFTSELPDSEVQNFLNAQHREELEDDFVELMIDSYKAPPVEVRATQEDDTLSQQSGISRGSTKSWLSKFLPARSRTGTSLYLGSARSKEETSETRYTHLQVVSHHDRPSLLPLDNRAFPHHPCTSACDAQRTSTIWASLSPLCEALILDYLSRNCVLPLPSKWQLHSAWPVTQQISRRGRHLQRALLGSQLLSWQGSFIVVFSALCTRPQSPTNQAEVSVRAQPREMPINDSQKTAEHTVPEDRQAETQNIRRQSDQADLSENHIAPVSHPPDKDINHQNEDAALRVKPSTPPRRVGPFLQPPQQYDVEVPQNSSNYSLLDHASGQLVHRPSLAYPQAPYGSKPYPPPSVPSTMPTAPAHAYSRPAGLSQSGTLVPYMGVNPFSPYHSSYEPPQHHLIHVPMPFNGGIEAQKLYSSQPPPVGYSHWPVQTPVSVLTSSGSYSHKSKPKSQTKSTSPNLHRSRRHNPQDDTTSSSSSGPESIYPSRTSSGIGSRRAQSIPIYPSSTSERKSTVTFKDTPQTSLLGEASSSSTREPSSHHAIGKGLYRSVRAERPTTNIQPTHEASKDHSQDEVASEHDSETFDEMVVEYISSGRQASRNTERDDDSDNSWASMSEDSPGAAQHRPDSRSASKPSSLYKYTATVQGETSEDDGHMRC